MYHRVAGNLLNEKKNFIQISTQKSDTNTLSKTEVLTNYFDIAAIHVCMSGKSVNV